MAATLFHPQYINSLKPFRNQAITWTNADILSAGALATILSEIRIKL